LITALISGAVAVGKAVRARLTAAVGGAELIGVAVGVAGAQRHVTAQAPHALLVGETLAVVATGDVEHAAVVEAVADLTR
jgi:hypothetical protein